jgi:hypothetical protein
MSKVSYYKVDEIRPLVNDLDTFTCFFFGGEKSIPTIYDMPSIITNEWSYFLSI